mgnify:FL=1
MHAHALRAILETIVNQTFDQVNFSIVFLDFNSNFFLFFSFSAVCELNCSPGYCFANPSGQPAFACYCTDNSIHLKTCSSR